MNMAFTLKQQISGASVVVALASAGLIAVPVSVLAQASGPFKMHCVAIGHNPPEAIGDRPGHSITLSEFACRVEGGPIDGGEMTGTQIYEWDGVNGVGKAGFGVVRRPDAKIVYVNTEMKNTLTMTDGKVTGYVATGRGYYPVATGTAASFAGKTYSYIAKPTGADQFIIESTFD